MTRHPSPRDGLLRRLREALTMYELSRANGTVRDGSLAVLVRDALEQFDAECDDSAAADAVEYAAMWAEAWDSEVMF